MTALEILANIWRITGGPGTAPTDITGQTGYADDCVSWMQEAWRYVQGMEHLWWWKFDTDTLGLSSGTFAYSTTALGIADCRFLDMENVLCYDSGIGVSDERKLTLCSRDEFRDMFLSGTQTAGRPTHIAQLANYTYGIGPSMAATDSYWLFLPYYTEVTDFALKTDVPPMPLEYQDIIMYRAAMYWAAREENQFRLQELTVRFEDLQNKIRNDPRMMQGYEWALKSIGAR